ncbi:MAG: replication associated protein [Wigfec virus K19_450]|nr:MAG: replication associated protein [Wigfec virus K19_450]
MQAKHVALTYSNIQQQDVIFTKEELFAHLWAIPNVQNVVVSKEKHESGSDHFHAYVSFKRKPDIRSSRFFDYKGCHPNLQPCKKVQAWLTYIKKDGDFLENDQNKSLFSICQAMDYRQWIEQCIQDKIAYPYMEKIWELCHKPRDNTILERPDGNFQCDALKNLAFDNWNYKSLVIYGESGIGKTNWAKWHMELPSLFVSHLDSLRDFDSSFHKSIIFDDVSFMHMPRESQIHVVDQFDPRSIHCRYRVANIPAGTPKVFTANRRIFQDDPAINRRIFVVKVNNYNYE